ncbi:hypothetical protein [Kitasatospora albolonga]|uniref:hypothetical protein n=1 Tax=Kitasatospora albolonga TaxID=68173 RepID=UPI0035ED0A2A
MFTTLVDGDVPAPEGLSGALYRLYPGPVDAAGEPVERLTAGDLVAALAPRPAQAGPVARTPAGADGAESAP